MKPLKRYMIERDIPDIGKMSTADISGASRKSNEALAEIGPGVQWQHSYVTKDRTYCIYLAEDEAAIRRHAELSGIPASRITEISKIIDPMTANA